MLADAGETVALEIETGTGALFDATPESTQAATESPAVYEVPVPLLPNRIESTEKGTQPDSLRGHGKGNFDDDVDGVAPTVAEDGLNLLPEQPKTDSGEESERIAARGPEGPLAEEKHAGEHSIEEIITMCAAGDRQALLRGMEGIADAADLPSQREIQTAGIWMANVLSGDLQSSVSSVQAAIPMASDAKATQMRSSTDVQLNEICDL